jgi:hypothetical protein
MVGVYSNYIRFFNTLNCSSSIAKKKMDLAFMLAKIVLTCEDLLGTQVHNQRDHLQHE